MSCLIDCLIDFNKKLYAPWRNHRSKVGMWNYDMCHVFLNKDKQIIQLQKYPDIKIFNCNMDTGIHEVRRGPSWRSGPHPPTLPPPTPPTLGPQISYFPAKCSNFCQLHCSERSDLLKSVTPIQLMAEKVRYIFIKQINMIYVKVWDILIHPLLNIFP